MPRRKPAAEPVAPPAPVAPEWERPTTPDALWTWISTELGVHVPRRAVIRHHAAPFDYLCATFFEPGDPAATVTPNPAPESPSRDVVLWANRGGGKTFLGAVATLLDLVFKPGIDIRVLGGSREQSTRVFEHLRKLLDPARHERLAAMVDGRITARDQVMPGDAQRARDGRQQRDHRLHQRALAATGTPADHEDLARLHGEVDPRQHRVTAVADRKVLGFDHGLG